jgi:hypothetical protein
VHHLLDFNRKRRTRRGKSRPVTHGLSCGRRADSAAWTASGIRPSSSLTLAGKVAAVPAPPSCAPAASRQALAPCSLRPPDPGK